MAAQSRPHRLQLFIRFFCCCCCLVLPDAVWLFRPGEIQHVWPLPPPPRRPPVLFSFIRKESLIFFSKELSGVCLTFISRLTRSGTFVYYFAAISLFRSRLSSRATKIILYKKLIRPEVLCGAEGWTVTEREEQAVLFFEREIFRRICGAKYENGNWKSGTNRELEEMSKGENIVTWIKGQRISWLGH